MKNDLIKDIDKFLNKSKYCFILIYSDWCKHLSNEFDNFFKDKYDLNKSNFKINIENNKDLIEKLELKSYPIIKIYNRGIFISELNCNSNKNFLFNLLNIYNFLK